MMVVVVVHGVLQGVATSYSVRVTFISGDVHVGAFGCFQAHPKQPIRVADPKYMLQVGLSCCLLSLLLLLRLLVLQPVSAAHKPTARLMVNPLRDCLSTCSCWGLGGLTSQRSVTTWSQECVCGQATDHVDVTRQ